MAYPPVRHAARCTGRTPRTMISRIHELKLKLHVPLEAGIISFGFESGLVDK